MRWLLLSGTSLVPLAYRAYVPIKVRFPFLENNLFLDFWNVDAALIFCSIFSLLLRPCVRSCLRSRE